MYAFDRVDRHAVESSRFVSASTPVLHPFCKLTVIWLSRCPAVSIDRHSPIRHRNVRESLFPAPRAGARTLIVQDYLLHLYMVTHFAWSSLLLVGTKVKRIDFQRAIAISLHNGRLLGELFCSLHRYNQSNYLLLEWLCCICEKMHEYI